MGRHYLFIFKSPVRTLQRRAQEKAASDEQAMHSAHYMAARNPGMPPTVGEGIGGAVYGITVEPRCPAVPAHGAVTGR